MQLTSRVRSYLEQTSVTTEQCKIPWKFSYQTDNLPNQEVEQDLNRQAELRTMAALGVSW